MKSLAVAFAVLASSIAFSDAGWAQAKKGASSAGSCPGGISACIARCQKAGGQPRNCPTYCQRQKGC